MVSLKFLARFKKEKPAQQPLQRYHHPSYASIDSQQTLVDQPTAFNHLEYIVLTPLSPPRRVYQGQGRRLSQFTIGQRRVIDCT